MKFYTLACGVLLGLERAGAGGGSARRRTSSSTHRFAHLAATGTPPATGTTAADRVLWRDVRLGRERWQILREITVHRLMAVMVVMVRMVMVMVVVLLLAVVRMQQGESVRVTRRAHRR
uniref:Secreted protein n=1 Tax=Anopheles melas TaxID=34690 RepID=A0A182TL81_9DIPT